MDSTRFALQSSRSDESAAIDSPADGLEWGETAPAGIEEAAEDALPPPTRNFPAPPPVSPPRRMVAPISRPVPPIPDAAARSGRPDQGKVGELQSVFAKFQGRKEEGDDGDKASGAEQRQHDGDSAAIEAGRGGLSARAAALQQFQGKAAAGETREVRALGAPATTAWRDARASLRARGFHAAAVCGVGQQQPPAAPLRRQQSVKDRVQKFQGAGGSLPMPDPVLARRAQAGDGTGRGSPEALRTPTAPSPEPRRGSLGKVIQPLSQDEEEVWLQAQAFSRRKMSPQQAGLGPGGSSSGQPPPRPPPRPASRGGSGASAAVASRPRTPSIPPAPHPPGPSVASTNFPTVLPTPSTRASSASPRPTPPLPPGRPPSHIPLPAPRQNGASAAPADSLMWQM